MPDQIALTETPFFLQQLELGLDADARAIRRAYARLLKLIDQEQDPGAFQELREAYELALAWAGQDHALPALPLKQADEDEVLADAVFERLIAMSEAMAANPDNNDIKHWSTELERCLDDDALFDMSARADFENRIAIHLANGWAPGKDMLLSAAAIAFEWENDRRRLAQFGPAGELINRAIDEKRMFDGQTDIQLKAQRDVLTYMRGTGLPNRVRLSSDTVSLERMLSRFPNLMSVWIDEERVQQWRDAYIERVGRPYVPAAKARELSSEEQAAEDARLLLPRACMMVLFALYAASKFF